MAKVALITGGSSGIGAATALLFSKLGCRVAISGRNMENLNKTKTQCLSSGLKESDVLPVKADMTKQSDLSALVNTTIERFGKLDILVNSAGIAVFDPAGPSGTPIEVLDKLFHTDVRGVVELTQLCLPHLKASKGSIVNVSAITASVALPMAAYYCMAKAALDQFTRCLAMEQAKNGVRVNSVNPAAIRTNIMFTEGMGMKPEQFPAFEKGLANTYPLGRIGEADEVAKSIWFLANNDDSSFITGQTLNICGGISVAFAGALPKK